jgi:hypothetical protein
MGVYLDVPFVSQLNYGGGMNDPTGCWYCSAQMVAFHFESGPRRGVPEIHSATGHAATGSALATQRLTTAGATKTEHELLAEREQLRAVPKCQTTHNFTPDELEMMLREYGPVFFYWMKTHGGHTYGHASVIIGTETRRSTSSVIYHDPENAPNSRMTVGVFNTKRQKWKYAMMQRKGVTSFNVTIKGQRGARTETESDLSGVAGLWN